MKRMTYGIGEAAAMLGLSRTTIYKMIGDGRLGRVKIGARALIPADDLNSLLDPKPSEN